jgi:O-antigen ligase
MALSRPGRGLVLLRLKKAGAICVVLACFFTPLSTTLLGLFSLLAVIAWILSGGFSDLPRTFVDYPHSCLALVLFSFMALAITYSPVNLEQGVDTLRKYRELLLMPIVISLMSLSRQYREMAENGFVSGCIVLLLASYGMAFGLLPEHRYGYSLVFHITHSFFMAVLSFWAIHRCIDSRQFRYFWIAVYVATVINLFYIAPGRTGMLVFLCLMILFFMQRLRLIQWLGGLTLLAVLVTSLYFTSENFSGRLQEAASEIQAYTPGSSRTSIGQRFDWWISSLDLVREKPVLGHGTGSFSAVLKKLTEKTGITQTDNPHNEYLLLTVQFGAVGLCLFLAMIVLQLLNARQMEGNKRWLIQGVVLALLSGSLINSLLFDSQQGHFYLFMSAALLNGHPTSKRLIYQL